MCKTGSEKPHIWWTWREKYVGGSENIFKRVFKGEFCSLFIVFSLVWHLLCGFSCFPKLSCTESTAPITLIGSVNILTNSVGLFYLSFSQMYNLTLPRQPASPQHLRLLSLELITWRRILPCSEIRNWFITQKRRLYLCFSFRSSWGEKKYIGIFINVAKIKGNKILP